MNIQQSPKRSGIDSHRSGPRSARAGAISCWCRPANCCSSPAQSGTARLQTHPPTRQSYMNLVGYWADGRDGQLFCPGAALSPPGNRLCRYLWLHAVRMTYPRRSRDRRSIEFLQLLMTGPRIAGAGSAAPRWQPQGCTANAIGRGMRCSNI